MNSFKAIVLTIFIIFGMIIVPTIYKVYKTHNKNLLVVVEEEFTYYARHCYNEGKCSNINVSLKELYDNNYLKDKLTNPISKKYYSEESSVDLTTYKVNLIS